MRISDAELDYWGNVFCQNGLSRYMTFATFISAPESHIKRIFDGEFRPLLANQRKVRERMETLGRYDLIEKLEQKGVLNQEPTVTAQTAADEIRNTYLNEARRLRYSAKDVLETVIELEELADEHFARLQLHKKCAAGGHHG